MRDNGFVVDRIFSKYGSHDPRAWTVLVNPGHASVFITCMRNVEGLRDNYFEITDGGQFTPQRFKIITDSLEVIIGYLNDFGIIAKTAAYNEGGPKNLRETQK